MTKLRELAYERWESRGRPLGDDWADWFSAEARVQGERSRTETPRPTRVLVLDTNLLLGAPQAVLQKLRDEGHTLRLSVIGLEERLARAASDGIEPLRKRLRNVSQYIDAEQPFVPQGGPLYARLGIHDTDPQRRENNNKYNAELPRMWARLIAGDIPNWQGLATGMMESIDRLADFIRTQLGSLAGLSKEGVTYGMVRSEAAKLYAEHPVVRRFGALRLDAMIARVATMIFNTPQLPTANDVEDLALLEHLADDIILLTGDHKFITAVDATGSLQAPFVRSAWEILDGRAPDGPPWGPSAMTAVNAHTRRTRRSLRDVESNVMARLDLMGAGR
jgi:hypothetical protein